MMECFESHSLMRSPTKRRFTTNCFMSLRSPTEDENGESSCRAWIAGVQVRTKCPETSLSACTPCWNDTIEEWY